MGRRLGEDANLAAAPLAQSLSSRPSGRGQRGGAAGTPWRLRRSRHLTQLASRFVSRLASQQCTQMPQNGAERPFPPICVHSCVPTAARNSATAQQCTQTPQSGAERPDPPICVHYCDPKATHNPSPRRNSVHKCPETVLRGRFRRSVYTIASSHLSTTAQQPNSVHKRPNPVRRGHFGQSVYTPASSPWR